MRAFVFIVSVENHFQPVSDLADNGREPKFLGWGHRSHGILVQDLSSQAKQGAKQNQAIKPEPG